MPFPSADTRHPIKLNDGTEHDGLVFLSNVIDHPRMEIGDYTYASSFDPPSDWAARLAPYMHVFSPERLVIGKFCQIADDAIFITASANHRYDGFSSFPFAAFAGGKMTKKPSFPKPGRDTVIGNDVWIGHGATVLPGATIGDGVIIGAGSVVGGDVPPYSVVAGNPARIVRRRFDDDTIAALLDIQWWNWNIESIVASEAAISGANLDALMASKPN